MRTGSKAQHGFGYLLVLFTLAAMGLLLAGAGQVWHTVAQRDKEEELLFIGHQFRQALGSYLERSPDAAKQYPTSLADLLQDKRFPMPVRHLRQLYRDPMTGTTQWGLVMAGGRIVGVHSLSQGVALKTLFQGRDEALTGMPTYDQWVFSHTVKEEKPAPATATAATKP